MSDRERASILIVDDSPENLTILGETLQPYYDVKAANSGERGMQIARRAPHPDLILLDLMMPGADGYEVFENLQADPATRSIPVIFVTGMNGVDAELRGLESGAVDYIVKPIVPQLLLARVRTQLELKTARERLLGQNAELEAEVVRRVAQNEMIQEVAIRALAHLAETRDPETGNHILRTQEYVRHIANGLKVLPHFAGILTENYIQMLVRSAPLHDIGKVGIPDHILLKPGPLSPAEWEVMKTHARLGRDAIDLAERDTSQPVDFLDLAKEIAHWHHERWDGTGYPDGLAGDSIPVSARIMALADVFDALISRRVYKEPLSYATSRQLIALGRERHFDPDVVDVFLDHFGDFCTIADRLREPEGELYGREAVCAQG